MQVLILMIAGIILAVLGFLTKQFGLCWGVAAILFGLVVILAMKDEPIKSERRNGLWLGGILVAAGGGMLGAWVLYYVSGWGIGLTVAIPTALCGIVIFCAAIKDIFNIVVCTQKVQAKCVRVKVKHENKGVDNYSYDGYIPEFCFQWEGRDYQVQMGITYSKRKADYYKSGRKYPIYINPRNPWTAREHRRPDPIVLVMLPLGIFLILVGISMVTFGI